MSLENVSSKILTDVEAKIKQLDTEIKSEAEVILRDAKKKSEEIITDSIKDAEGKISIIERKELASANLESKKPLLDAKRQLIERTYSDVEKSLSSLDETTKKSILKTLFDNSKDQMSDISKIYADKNDLKIIKSFSGSLTLCEKDMLGGMIVENKDGTVRIDNSFELLLETTRKTTLKGTADILFN